MMSARDLVLVSLLAVVPGLGHGGQDEAAKYYEDGLTRFEQNDVDGAIIQLKNALKEDPRLMAAQVLLGRAYLRTVDPAAAEIALEKALQLGVSRSEVVVPLAQALYEQGKYRDLLDRLQPDTTATQAQRVELLVLRGHAFKMLGERQDAAESYRRARAADPRHVPAILSEADLLAEDGKRPEAEEQIGRALAIAPNDPVVWTRKGSVAHAYGDVETALAAYDKALAIDPAVLEARVGRAGLLVDLGRLQAAETDLDYLVKEAPGEPRAHYLKAVVLNKRGDGEAARKELLEATAILDALPPEVLKARIPQGLLLGGLCHYGLGQQEKAEKYLADFVAANPRHPGARKLLGSIYLGRGNYPDAISVLEPARRQAPNDPDTLALLAAAYAGRSQFETSNQLLEEALRASGNAPEVQAKLGLSLIGMGQQGLGLEHLQAAYAKDPSQTRVGYALTIMYLRQQEIEAAVELAGQIAARDRTAVSQNLLGVVRQAAGDTAGAQAAYRKALDLDAAFLPAELNLARLELAAGDAPAARGRLQRILAKRPEDPQATFELAQVEDAAGNTAEALRLLEKLHGASNANVQVTARLVDVLIRTGAADKALTAAKETHRVAPEDLTALATLGQAHVAVADYKSAQVVYARMARQAAFDAGWQYRIAQYQLAASNPEGAVHSLQRVLETQPDHVPAQVLLTEIELQLNRVDEAEQRARLLAASPANASTGQRLLGDIALSRGDAAGAVANYEAALQAQPTTDLALRLYRARFVTGQGGAAVEFMESWVREHQEDAVARRALAEGYLRVGRLGEARTAYEDLLRHEPDSPELLNNLANVLARQGNATQALDYAQRAYAKAPQDAMVQDTLGWLLVQAGQLETGLRHLREARLREPQNPDIRYHLAAALARSGRTDEARSELREAFDLDGEFEDPAAARELRQQLGG